MKTIHFTNRNTLQVYGYESLEEAQAFNDNFENLVEMTDELFIDFRDNRPKGGRWTWDKGWVVDGDKLKEEIQLEQEVHKQNLLYQIQDMNLKIQEHILMDEKHEAKELVLQKRKLEEELNSIINIYGHI